MEEGQTSLWTKLILWHAVVYNVTTNRKASPCRVRGDVCVTVPRHMGAFWSVNRGLWGDGGRHGGWGRYCAGDTVTVTASLLCFLPSSTVTPGRSESPAGYGLCFPVWHSNLGPPQPQGGERGWRGRSLEGGREV